MYYCIFHGQAILKTNDLVEARKRIIKRVMRSPKYEWFTYRYYISTDKEGKNKIEEIAYTNKVSLNPNAYPEWASKKKGSTTWREICWDGSSDDGYIIPQSIAAMNLSYNRSKKKIVKKV